MSRSTFKVLFYLKRDKQKTNGLIPLFCRITVDGKEVRFGMKCDVNPKFWDVKASKASGRTTEATKTNSLIDNTKAAIYKVYRELQERDNYVTAEKVRNVFLGGEIKQQTLLELLDKHNKERKLLIGVSICQWNYGSYYEPNKAQEELNLIHDLFPMMKENLRMAELCKKIGIGIEYIKMLFSDKSLTAKSFSFFSPEHNQKFTAENINLKIEKEQDNPNKLRLTLNGINILDWFRQKYQEVQRKVVPLPKNRKTFKL
ncbi:hypothetical protein AGMMS50239_01770 [Bacteroidia bacterium]|nr:hypothetical protein AGMMS50239_01770 [Bacteroidia bacterium]